MNIFDKQRDIVRKSAIILLLLIPLTLAACGPAVDEEDSPLVSSAGPTPTLEPLTPGRGAMVGQINARPSIPAGARVFLASFFRNEAGDAGFFVMEPNLAPQTTLRADGTFQINNIDPGEYVITVGIIAEESVVMGDPQNPNVYPIQAGEVLDTGVQEVDLSGSPAFAPPPVDVPPDGAYPYPSSP